MVEEKLKILRSIFGDSKNFGDEYLFKCKSCNHPKKKLSINIKKDQYKCWICDTRGTTVRRLIRRYGNYNQKIEWDRIDGREDLTTLQEVLKFRGKEKKVFEEIIGLPKEFVTLTSKNTKLFGRIAKKYLFNRGVNEEDILKWKIGYCASGRYEGRIIIPSFDMAGRVNYFSARSFFNEGKKYMNPARSKDLVFSELYVNWEQDVSLVEGVFDAIVAGNAVPLLGSSLNENSRLFDTIIFHDTPIYLALDPDAEKKKAKVLIKKLIEYGVELYKVDITPYGDVGEMTKKEYARRKAEAIPINNESYLMYVLESL